MEILTAGEMRRVEQECERSGLPPVVLMENAGRAVAQAANRMAGDVSPSRVLILIGPGNNGGDGLVAGRYLHDWGADVELYLLSRRPSDDRNLALARDAGIPVIDGTQDSDFRELEGALTSANVVADAVFGTGKSRAITGAFAGALQRLGEEKKRRPGLRILAVDLPSGLDADTGMVDTVCPRVDKTIALGFPKRGLFNMPGAEWAGHVEVVDIGIPTHLSGGVSTRLITEDDVRSVLPVRALTANKGTFGRVMVVAGSINYVGAAYLACAGATRAGAGLVTLATAASLHPVLAGKLTEVTHLPLPDAGPGILGPAAAAIVLEALPAYNVLLFGCGLGQADATVGFVERLVAGAKNLGIHLVADADGLNILSRSRRWWQMLPDDAIVTPHPGEMSRLTDMTVEAIQSDRLGLAAGMAQEWRKTVVLKGAYTVVAGPGNVLVSPFANPGLATAGTGDVLAGAVAGMLAQGLAPLDAAMAAVYVHGKAGEMVSRRFGDAGIVAGDLLPVLPLAAKSIKRERPAVRPSEEDNAAGN